MMAEPFQHGTSAGYQRHHCRCDACRLTHNARVRRNRAERLAAGRLTHGTASAYDAGCRCDFCSTVHAARNRAQYRAAKKASAMTITLGGPVPVAFADIDAAIDRVTAAPEWAVDAAVES